MLSLAALRIRLSKLHPLQALASVYFEEKPGRRIGRRTFLTRDEARRIAANIAKLPELLAEISEWNSSQRRNH
jgi:hypothetical protein